MSVFIGNKNKRVELAERKDATNPNLFTGSKDFTGDWLNEEQVKQKDKYLDFTAIYDNWAWAGISQYIAANKGDTFTVSAYIKANAGSSFSWFTLLNSDNEGGYTKTDTSPNASSITTTGDWQKTSMTFTVTGDSGAIRPRIESDGTAPFWIAGMKLEKGTVATDWCPALEDYAWTSDITNLQNTVNQLKGRQVVEAPDFNTLTDTGIYDITNPQNGKNFPTTSYGVLTVLNASELNASNSSDMRIMQIYAPDYGNTLFVRTPYNSNKGAMFTDWNQIAWQSDITNLQSMITGLSTKVDSLQQSSHKIVPITQDDYDNLNTKDPNTIYAIGG